MSERVSFTCNENPQDIRKFARQKSYFHYIVKKKLAPTHARRHRHRHTHRRKAPHTRTQTRKPMSHTHRKHTHASIGVQAFAEDSKSFRRFSNPKSLHHEDLKSIDLAQRAQKYASWANKLTSTPTSQIGFS